MKAGKYSIKELFNNRYVEQIIIPEIQRDYVWGEKQVEGLLKSICESYNEFTDGVNLLAQPDVDDEIRISFEQYYKKQKFSCNIGFIYAYNDPEYAGKYFLIDGQQRLTTIYLLLLVLASEQNAFRAAFEKFYLSSGLPVIDYKVREASHQFLKEVASNYIDKGIFIEDQPWYYKDYENDQTITSIISNIKTIRNFLLDKKLVNNSFISYVQEYIEFWYFDTSISEQGEELYIYMNARGEHMQENENLKADLLGKLKIPEHSLSPLMKIKNDWGLKWEEWQNFFWTNRESNENADKGFNEFICCISGLENYLNYTPKVFKKEDFDDSGKTKLPYSDILESLSKGGLTMISNYVEALKYLFDKANIERFKSNYKEVGWVDKCLDEILRIFNTRSTNWFADLKDSNRGLEHSRMVFIWSLIRYLTIIDKAKRSNNEIFRVLRLYYIRFNNYNRSVLSIKNDVKNIDEYGPWKIIGSEEENKKSDWYTEKIAPNEIFQFEELIWSIEDHPLNLAGRDLKALNCSHLIDFSSPPSLNNLKIIKEKFYTLFPKNKDDKVSEVNEEKLVTTLLFYGKFWERVSPWYCLNYHFGNWGKIIRNIDIEDLTFSVFFEEFKLKSLDELYSEKIIVSQLDKETTSLQEQLKWYAGQIKKKMWQQGLFIATNHYKYPKVDRIFVNSKEILNTKGDFKGGSPARLSTLIKVETHV